jgi:hypothetical protein
MEEMPHYLRMRSENFPGGKIFELTIAKRQTYRKTKGILASD